MKKIIFLLFLIVLGLLARPQSSYNKVKYYIGDSTNTHQMIQSFLQFDTLMFLAMDFVDGNNNRRLSVVKTDLDGNEIKKVLYGGVNEYHGTFPGNAMIIDKDSNILICNSYYDITNDYYEEGYLIKLNLNLDTLWIKTYDLPGSLTGFGCPNPNYSANWFTAIKQTLDGGYILAGNYGLNCNIGDQRSYLIKVNSAGNVEWRKVYSDVKRVFDIEVLPDSSFIFNDVFTGYAINKTDKYGNIVWKNNPNNLVHLASACDIKYKDDYIISASGYRFTPNGTTKRYGVDIVKSDTAGQLIWNKQFFLHHSFDCPGIHNHFEINIDSFGDIYIAGTSDIINAAYTARGYKGVILKLNSNGDSLWSRYYGIKDFDDNCQFNDFIFTNDGGMMAVGYHVPDNGAYNFGAWLVKMDSMGLCPGSYTVSIDNKEFEKPGMKLYPNPTNDYLNLEFEDQHIINQEGFIHIVKMDGQTVKTVVKHAGTSNLQINILNLEAGSYLIYLFAENKRIASSLFTKIK